jgi:hypothetical protein
MLASSLRRLPILIALALYAPTPTTAQVAPIEEQIKGAVLALPSGQRAAATVLGFRTAGTLSVIREGSGDMTCLADEAGNETYHVSCYHNSLEPMMTFGRDLSARGIVDPERDRLRAAAADDGSLSMPTSPAAFHSLTGPETSWDPAAGTFTDAGRLHTIYMPWATEESTGLSVEPGMSGQPWLMYPGNYRAHVMIVPAAEGPGGR